MVDEDVAPFIAPYLPRLPAVIEQEDHEALSRP